MYKTYLRHFPLLAVDVLFFDAAMKRTLLFKRNNEPLRGKYFSMGGRLAKNEPMLDAAARKAKEETGILIDKKKLFFGGIQEEMYVTSIFPSVDTHSVVVYFGYILNSDKKIMLDTQHSMAKWFSVSDAKLQPRVKSKIQNLRIAYDKAH